MGALSAYHLELSKKTVGAGLSEFIVVNIGKRLRVKIQLGRFWVIFVQNLPLQTDIR